MAPPVPLLAVRGTHGLSLLSGPPKCEPHTDFNKEIKACRCFSFSSDGALFAWSSGSSVCVVKSTDGSSVSSFDLPKISLIEVSPLGNILATWQVYTKTESNPQGEANLQLWDINTNQLIKALYQKKQENWCPSWSQDEKLCVRNVNNELHFYEDNDFNTIANKLHLQKVSDFSVSPGGQPSKVCVYVPGSKGAPSFVRLYQYPVLGGPSAALANKSFFKADKVNMAWNSKGTAVIVTASVEVDKSGASYYGEQTLHFLSVAGETAHIQLPKNGPIYDVQWSPNGSEFCVVYGFMPAKATVFSLKCDPVFDFGTGPRNAAYYSPQGHVLVLAGFGNLRGNMEVWDVQKYKQISKPQAQDATHFSWSPDGEHLCTSTCSPRLRVSNGYKLWHYTGALLHSWEVAQGAELWQVTWQSFKPGTFPARPIRMSPPANQEAPSQAPPPQAYRPPALRHLPAAPSAKLYEEELPQNLRPGSEKPLSKTALKNQRKRENKKTARQEVKGDPEPSCDQSCDPAPQPVSQSEPSTGDPETDRKIKSVKKKLKAIDELKEQQAAGKVLQKNQLDKVQKEDQLLKELEELQIDI